ncbi:winged helix-turn-helix transcriptional regulator [Herbidospora galbida]|uniref:Winged helix-turn-helix transcriptional regulator n=1 Tax=Herbidospora galbida TaxID=2575442 RepID=A0A4V6XB78_9ACTN|nr:MarR family winged helix-turn-helix transcriptional regulator [Herbidospora galbida]TKK80753.1 winged helix-turn-helix transcriptional regulator [Herbidospora galbida]
MTDVDVLAERLKTALARLARRSRRQTRGDLTAGQTSTLGAVATLGPVRLVDLAAEEGVSAPTLSRVVAGLEHLGLVTRVADPADGRASLISLTPTGRAELTRLRGDGIAFFAARINALPADQRSALAAALPAIEALAGPS